MKRSNSIFSNLRLIYLILLLGMVLLPAAASAEWVAEITSENQLEPVYFGYDEFVYEDQVTLNDRYVAAPRINRTIMKLDDIFSRNIKSQDLTWKFSISVPSEGGTEITWNVSSIPSNVSSVTLLINDTMVEMRDTSAYHLPAGYHGGQLVVRHDPSNIYVDGSGSANYTTIQEAVDAAFKGDTIIVKDGVYNETVNVMKSVAIISENGAHNTILHASLPPLEPGQVQVGEKKIGFCFAANNVTIRGFQVYGASGSDVEGQYGGIRGSGANCIVSDNIIRNNKGGIDVNGNGLQIMNNTVSSNSVYGIRVGGSGMIQNNTINGNSGEGLRIVGLSQSDVMDNDISGNTEGISLAAGYNRIAGNTIENNAYGLYFERSMDSDFIYANNILNNGRQVRMNGPGGQTFELRLSPYPMSYVFNNQNWPPSTLGNYWGPRTASGSNGIGTRSYIIPYQSCPYIVDKYPLVGPWDDGVILIQ